MTRVAVWVAGARPRTLPAAVSPVLVGSGVAIAVDSFRPVPALLCLLISLALQVGVNYANDYSDGLRGTDTVRVGPARLVGQGLANPADVRTAAVIALGSACGFGALLIALSGQWWLAPVGASAVAAAWLYTGGPRPYGYAGLGELMVLVYFGLVAVIGTTVVQTGRWEPLALLAALPIGLLASAILMANNIRDIPTDIDSGKRTVAVRLGSRGARILYIITVAAAFALIVPIATVRPWALLALVSLPLAVPALQAIAAGPSTQLAGVSATGRLHLAFGILLALGCALGD